MGSMTLTMLRVFSPLRLVISGLCSVLLSAGALGASKASQEPVDESVEVRLYVMDGGSLDVADMASFSRDSDLEGRSIHLVNPSFLVRHPKGDLLWDTGYTDALAELPDGSQSGVWHSRRSTTLLQQLAQLELKPVDIEYLALSHAHPDHSGNANLFADSTFIVHEKERAFMFSEDAMAAYGEVYSELRDAETLLFTGRHDVFGDGRVVLFEMPGHTPGSSVLLIRLPNSGSFLLTGDLYTHAGARDKGTVPSFNADLEQTLESRRVFEELAAAEKARVIIQHSSADFGSLPTFPEFLD